MCATAMTSIRPGWDSNTVPSFEQQPDRMSHQGLLDRHGDHWAESTMVLEIYIRWQFRICFRDEYVHKSVLSNFNN